jgi:DedD protein
MRLPFQRPPATDGPADSDPNPARRRAAAAASPGDESASVEAARTRARQRLVGALVLLAIGVIGFPVLFETQPRPVAIDTPIETAVREPGARSVTGAVTALPRMPAPPPPADAGTEGPADPTAALPAASSTVAAARTAAASATPAAPAPKPATAVATAAPSRPVAVPEPAAVPAPPASAGSAALVRFVVQVGAFTEARALREARQKVEALGFKTYTQVIEHDASRRTRVRVGPFETRSEAEAAARKIKAGGLPANILSL